MSEVKPGWQERCCRPPLPRKSRFPFSTGSTTHPCLHVPYSEGARKMYAECRRARSDGDTKFSSTKCFPQARDHRLLPRHCGRRTGANPGEPLPPWNSTRQIVSTPVDGEPSCLGRRKYSRSLEMKPSSRDQSHPPWGTPETQTPCPRIKLHVWGPPAASRPKSASKPRFREQRLTPSGRCFARLPPFASTLCGTACDKRSENRTR